MSLWNHSDFNRAFLEGQIFHSDQGRFRVRTLEAMDFVLASGEIMAGDPTGLMFRRDYQPFSRRIAPGRYPVDLAMACLENGAEYVAAARVRIGNARPVRYELGTRLGEEVETLEPLCLFGHGVDSGISCFADYRAVFEKTDAELERMFEGQDVLEAMGHSGVFGRVLDPTGANLIAFYSGWGDGFYPSWWGLDHLDGVVSLVTDFGVLSESVSGEIIFDQLPSRLGTALEHPELRIVGLAIQVHAGREIGRSIDIVVKGGSKSSCEFELLNGQTRISSYSCGTTYRGDSKFLTMSSASPLVEDSQLVVKFVKGIRAL
jgi:hypothetical protein